MDLAPIVLALVGALGDAPATPRGVDQFGDPLPQGAVARLGTARWRVGGYVYGLDFTPDGTRLASAAIDGTVRLWEVATGKELRRFGQHERLWRSRHEEWATSVAISPDGKLLASAGSTKIIQLWELASGKEVRRLKNHDGPISCLAFSADGKVLASGSGVISGGDQTLRLWDVHTGAELAAHTHGGEVRSVTFARRAKVLASASEDGSVRVWDAATAKQLGAFPIGSDVVRVALSSDGKLLAAGTDRRDCGGPKVVILEVASGKVLHRLEAASFGVSGLVFAPDDKTLYVAARNRKERRERLVTQWDVRTGNEVQRFGREQHMVTSLALSRDGKVLAVGTANSIDLYDAASGKPLHEYPGHRESIDAVAFAADGKTLVTGSADGSVRLWDAATGKDLGPLADDLGRVWRVGFAAQGKEILCAEGSNLWVWETATGRALRRLSAGKVLSNAAFAANGAVAAASLRPDGDLHVWDTASGKRLLHLTKIGTPDLFLSADGKRLVLTSAKSPDDVHLTVYVWDLAAGKKLFEFPLGGAGRVAPLHDVFALSPDGNALFVVHSDSVVLDVRTGKERTKLPNQERSTFSAAFSPDGTLLALGNWDHRIRLFDTASGKELAVFAGHQGHVNAVAFSPDGRRLASGSGDGSVLVWDVGKWRQRAEQ